jgi:DNA replication protein DnaC
VIATLAGASWVAAGEPLCLIGDSGTGKTHLLSGLGNAAAEAGHPVRYVLASRLVNELVEPPTNASSPAPSPATAR